MSNDYECSLCKVSCDESDAVPEVYDADDNEHIVCDKCYPDCVIQDEDEVYSLTKEGEDRLKLSLVDDGDDEAERGAAKSLYRSISSDSL